MCSWLLFLHIFPFQRKAHPITKIKNKTLSVKSEQKKKETEDNFFSIKGIWTWKQEGRGESKNYKCKDSHGDVRLSVCNSTSVSILNACKDVGRLPSGG